MQEPPSVTTVSLLKPPNMNNWQNFILCTFNFTHLNFVQTKNETSAAQKPRIFVWTKGIQERATSSKVSAPLLPFWVLEKGCLKENLIGCYELLLRGRCFLNLWAVPKGFRTFFFFFFLLSLWLKLSLNLV